MFIKFRLFILELTQFSFFSSPFIILLLFVVGRLPLSVSKSTINSLLPTSRAPWGSLRLKTKISQFRQKFPVLRSPRKTRFALS